MSNYKINVETILTLPKFTKQLIKETAKIVLFEEKAANAAITIVVVDDDYITKLHKDFLNKNDTTDVLSFQLEDFQEKQILEGEIYVNMKQIERQAAEYGVSTDTELRRIIIHGVLHLIGYDDQTSGEKLAMTKKEDYYLSILTNLINKGG